MQFGWVCSTPQCVGVYINPLNAELNPICHLLALLGAHHILHVSRIRVNISTQWNRAYLLRNKFSNTWTPACIKKYVVNYRITTQVVANKTIQRLCKCRQCPSKLLGAFLCACFSVYTCLTFPSNITRYTLYNGRLWLSLIWFRMRTIVGLLRTR